LCRLRVAADVASTTLVSLLQSKNEKIKLQTANVILNSLSKFIEFEKIESKLKDIEEKINEK